MPPENASLTLNLKVVLCKVKLPLLFHKISWGLLCVPVFAKALLLLQGVRS